MKRKTLFLAIITMVMLCSCKSSIQQPALATDLVFNVVKFTDPKYSEYATVAFAANDIWLTTKWGIQCDDYSDEAKHSPFIKLTDDGWYITSWKWLGYRMGGVGQFLSHKKWNEAPDYFPLNDSIYFIKGHIVEEEYVLGAKEIDKLMGTDLISRLQADGWKDKCPNLHTSYFACTDVSCSIIENTELWKHIQNVCNDYQKTAIDLFHSGEIFEIARKSPNPDFDERLSFD